METSIKLSIFLLSLISPYLILSQSANLEADINPGALNSNPLSAVVYDGNLYLSAQDDIHGRELWSYDGDSLHLVSDIYPGSTGSSPYSLIVYNSKLYFIASDSIHGRELWCHDGDSTYVAEDFIPGIGSFSISDLIVYNNRIYFKGNSYSGIGAELYSYNGDSIALEVDIYPGSGSSGLKDFCIAFNRLYFTANDGIAGLELFSYDGVSLHLEADINPASASSNPENLFYDGTNLYFSAFLGTTGRELWKFDGNIVQLVADINPGSASSNPKEFIEYNSKIYFYTSPINGVRMWNYDGVNLIGFSTIISYHEMIVYNNALYTSVTQSGNVFGCSNYNKFLRFDGTNFQNVLCGKSFYEGWKEIFDDKIFFSTSDGVTGYELWSFRSDTICTTPLNGHFIVNSQTSVSLNWDIELNATGYVIQGKEINSTNFTSITINNVFTSSIQINGLDPLKTYIWQIKAVCDSFGTESAYSAFDTFHIADFLCNIPEPVTTANVTSGSAVLRWTPVSSAEGYRILGKEVTSASLLSLYVPAPQDSLYVNLAPNKTYGWQIRAECGGINNSFYTYPEIFTTGAGPALKSNEDYNFPECIIYPNPFSNYTTIESANLAINQLTVYNLQGQQILQEQPETNEYILNRNNLPSGIYILHISTQEGNSIEKLLIE